MAWCLVRAWWFMAHVSRLRLSAFYRPPRSLKHEPLSNAYYLMLHMGSIVVLQGLYNGYKTNSGFGVWVIGGAILIVSFNKSMAQKLGIIILLHIRSVTCRFNFGKTRKVIMFMIFWFGDVSMTPKTDYVYVGYTKVLQRYQETSNVGNFQLISQ